MLMCWTPRPRTIRQDTIYCEPLEPGLMYLARTTQQHYLTPTDLDYLPNITNHNANDDDDGDNYDDNK
ncbi:hypothetical protein Cob_v002064 [Colletotrichum orbiculare MAFF 240422]|uniref:Uncharacterized protein n=1 Tax=Colletotrichum orbiculare (strain 104-T / ATCC 96160 / CBS 514.97 / LARS 414 / MAFF 240422) TaxID=1213857 RepID=A0A484G2W0_COLOR|nr:hypothetical protein Cob_v002064 [Colletotrichum orbiculare MAFF 240422]